MKRKRQKYTWLLLCLFVPMLLLASMHVHQPLPQGVPSGCDACLHHVHHSGHLSSTTLTVDNCPLCHFLSTPSVVANVVTILPLVPVCDGPVRLRIGCLESACIGASRPRAPPVCL